MRRVAPVVSRKDLATDKSTPLARLLTPAEIEARNATATAELAQLVEKKRSGTRAGGVRKDTEHRAQVILFTEEIPTAMERYPDLAWMLDLVYAVPTFNMQTAGWKAKAFGERLKAEGQKKGVPDIHVPFQRAGLGAVGDTIFYGSLYLELKAESYPSDEQRVVMPQLARAGNAVVTVREPDERKLAEKAMLTVVRYLAGKTDFYTFGHPSHTYIHNGIYPIGERP